MPCKYKHNYITVNNHYNDKGEKDTEDFSTGEWRTEKVCEKCGEVFVEPEFNK